MTDQKTATAREADQKCTYCCRDVPTIEEYDGLSFRVCANCIDHNIKETRETLSAAFADIEDAQGRARTEHDNLCDWLETRERFKEAQALEA